MHAKQWIIIQLKHVQLNSLLQWPNPEQEYFYILWGYRLYLSEKNKLAHRLCCQLYSLA